MEDKMINWIQNWFYQVSKEKCEKLNKFFLRNIDNPGWLLTLPLTDSKYNKNKIDKKKIDRTENDWCHCLIENNEFVDVGGPFNLNEMLNYFMNFIENKNESESFNIIENEIINWMENWYYQQCGDEWEDSERFIIKTTESGWFFSMFLEDTVCEDKFFDPVDIKKTESDWYSCYKTEYRFEAKGGIFNLVDILNVFINWVEECENK